MENNRNESIEDTIQDLKRENSKLKKSVRWMLLFIVVVFVIQVYNLLAGFFP